MAEPWDSLLALFPDNDQGFITAASMRTQVNTLETVDNENAKLATLDTEIFEPLQANDVMRWLGIWDTPGLQYLENDVVRDGDWLMRANKTTTDRPAPVAQGDPFWIYTGIQGSDNQVTAKTVSQGNRYTFNNPGYITGYRIDVVAGNHYEVLSVKDPLGAAETTFINAFTATVTGWREFGLIPEIIAGGTTFDLIAIINEPDPTPTTFAGPWVYSNPQNTTAPAAGQITQANSAVALMQVNKTDNNAADRSAELAGLTVGDTFNFNGVSWSIQSISDQGGYYRFGVAPAVQTATGTYTVTFETVDPTPISYHKDVDYWLTSPYGGQVNGLYVADDSYENVVPDDSAYGTDIQVQDADVSPDWDLLAVSSGVTGVGADVFETMTYDYNKTVGFTVPSTTYSEVDRLTVPGATAGTYEIKFSWTSTLDSTNTSQFFRYSIDAGATWNEFRIEPSAVDDQFPFTYFYPHAHLGGDFELIFQARKENAGDTMTIDFLDIIFQRVN